MKEEQIKELLINIRYKLSKDDIDNLIKYNSFDDIKEVIKNTEYKKILINETELEKAINEYLYLMYKKSFSKGKYNLCPAISYMYLQEIQKKNIIKILGGILYNLDKSKIEEKIII